MKIPSCKEFKNLNMESFNSSQIKAKLRRKRYEDTTFNKVCTVRAHQNMHSLIKEFAKNRKCPKCDINKENYSKKITYWRSELYKFKNHPSWDDEFTKRDCLITIYCFAFAYLFYQVNTNIFSW